MTSVWGVRTVAILGSSVNRVSVRSTKKLTMPVYCVAASCNNSQMTPGITMHELPHNRPAVRHKWTKFIQFKRADFLVVPHHAHLCSEHFSECNFANPMEYRMGFCFEADMMFWYSFKILPDGLKLIRLYLCGSLGQSVSFVFRARVGHFAATPQSDLEAYGHVIWASWWRFRYDRKCIFFMHLQPSDHSFTYIIVLSKL